MSERVKKREFLSMTMLKEEYGLTPKMIQDLGKPDKYGDIPHYISGQIACLYHVDRVEAWVAANREWLEEAKDRRAKREADRQAAWEQERLERLRRVTELVETAPVELRRPLPATLLDDAPSKCIHFSAKVDPFDSNALRNYVRTNFTNYGKVQDELSREECHSELGLKWKSRVDAFVNRLIADWKKQFPAVSEITLREVYGLTAEMIKELGEPDEYAENPNEQDGRQAGLYLIERVGAWVRANQDRVAKAKADRVKQEADRKAAEKQQRLERMRQKQQWMRTATVQLVRPLPATLLDDARKESSSPAKGNVLYSNAVRTYIRKHFTNYDTLLAQLASQGNGSELFRKLQSRADKAINKFISRWKWQHPDIVAAEAAARARETGSSAAA